jgi:hypothetical protein
MAAFVQLPGPQGWTERSWVTLSITVAGPKPSSAPVPVLISWNTPRSATRFMIDTVLSSNVASSRFPSSVAFADA